MSLLDRLFKNSFPPQRGKKPIFHNTIPHIDNPPYEYTAYILSGRTPGWFKLSDEPISKKMLLMSEEVIELSGRYVEFGAGFAVELKEEHSFIPEEYIGLRVRFI